MRLPQCWKKILLLTVFCLACLQYIFLSHCPGWICPHRDFSPVSLEAIDNQDKLSWTGEEPGKDARSSRRRAKTAGIEWIKSKVSRNVFGRYRNNGISLWDNEVDLKKDMRFSVNGSDVLVFLHIQKTGGTAFGKNMVKNLVDPSTGNNSCLCKPGSKRCKCYRPGSKSKEWLFSRFSTGWKCGLHADYTELTNCVDQVFDQSEGVPQKRRYFYMTLLRNPYRRYLSEFLHVRRGATWRTSRHWCGGRFASADEIRPCFDGDTWEGASLDDFINCPDNLATNRQTRMLADLELVGCYSKNSLLTPAERNAILLSSAKENLAKMAFFGIVEEMEDTQFAFQETFGLRLLETLDGSYEGRGENFTVSASQRELLLEKIHLDIQLYEFALNLFRRRVTNLKNKS